MTKIVAVTGGVYSSLGKGIITASLGCIFKELGYKVSVLKLDPYLNVDTNTLSPCQHGEVFVTYDGGETDLDLGHYERFLRVDLSKKSSVTSGQIYSEVISRERSGGYDGETVQVVPHIILEIKKRIGELLSEKHDILFLEVGGTIGDMESLPFIEALSRLRSEMGPENFLFVHISPIVYLPLTGEFKTKPTQHSVRLLRQLGASPDLLILRSPAPFPDRSLQKIMYNISLNKTKMFSCLDQESIYQVPQFLKEQGIHREMSKLLKLSPSGGESLSFWTKLNHQISDAREVNKTIFIVGKYTGLSDSYLSIIESFKLAGYEQGIKVKIRLVDCEKPDLLQQLSTASGICVPHGFGVRGVLGKMEAIKFCRENNIPFLGICFGMQLACIEYARNVLSMSEASSEEFGNEMGRQFIFKEQPFKLGSDSVNISQPFLQGTTKKRYRHRFCFDISFMEKVFGGDLKVVGSGPNNHVELIQLENHKFFYASQYHPEFGSKPGEIDPLFQEFIKAL